MNPSIRPLCTRGISWFIFRGGWRRGGRLDICKDGLQALRRTLFRLLNSLLHRLLRRRCNNIMVACNTDRPFPDYRKNCRLALRGDTTSTDLRSSISRHSKNYLTRKLSSSSLHHSLDSFFDHVRAKATTRTPLWKGTQDRFWIPA